MKKRRIILFISGVIIWNCGFFVLLLGVFNGYDDLQITESKSIELLLKIGGCLGFFLGIALLAFYLISLVKDNKELQIEEKDERNIAIRGKASQTAYLITTILLLVILVVFICINLNIAALLTGLVMLVHSFSLVFLIAYYSKKM